MAGPLGWRPWLAGLIACAVLAGCSTGGSIRQTGDGLAEVAAPTAAGDPRRGRRNPEQLTDDESQITIAVPERAAASFDRALAAMRNENWIEAEFELEQLVLEYRDFAGPWVNLAVIYSQDDRYDEAMDALDQALVLNPEHAAALNQKGILLREQGEFAAAEQAYRSAISADPGYAIAHYNLGVLLDLYLRRQTEALAAYETYQSLRNEPDETVARWIVDLRRRLGVSEQSARVAEEGGGCAHRILPGRCSRPSCCSVPAACSRRNHRPPRPSRAGGPRWPIRPICSRPSMSAGLRCPGRRRSRRQRQLPRHLGRRSLQAVRLFNRA
jgi:Flp pilus assembly protein TadD